MPNKPVIALTPGEPAGIGPDLAVRLIRDLQTGHKINADIVILANSQLLKDRASQLDVDIDLPLWRPDVPMPISLLPLAVAVKVRCGKLDPRNSPYVLQTLVRAIDGCLQGEFQALVTGPVHKGVINDAGEPFSGHTELLARQCKIDRAVMMLVTDLPADGHSRLHASRDTNASLRVGHSRLRASRDTNASLRVALATTHIPLSEVSQAISKEHLEAVLRILHTDLENKFCINDPRILVCGLNPHAGESGHLGREELDTITPVVDKLLVEGLNLIGPVAADTAFTPKRLSHIDAVLTMYHDQGLPVLKSHGFGRAVNVTLGLPFIRTSVDHGTALERAGTGNINNGSLMAALALAEQLVKRI